MGNYDEKVARPLSKVSGALIGQALLPALKATMIQQKVFRLLFGDQGESIFFEKLPNYNDTTVPLIEAQWKAERWQSQDTRLTGVLGGMIVLPADMDGNTDRFRAIAGAFMRWLNAESSLFDSVPGLIEIGTNADFRYDGAIKTDASLFPFIGFTLPVVFDLYRFQVLNPDIDLNANLDADLIGWIETYNLRIKDDKGHVKIDTQTLSKTGQEQDG